MDPRTDAEAERAEAERLDWEARREEDPNVRRSLVNAANNLEQEADKIDEEDEEARE